MRNGRTATAPEDRMSEEQDFEVVEPARRKDVQPEGVAPRKKRGRPPKRRQDSINVAPLDGFGKPFDIKLQKGWTAFWVSAFDASEHHGLRRWEPGTWGDPRVIEYKGVLPGEKGKPIVRKELTLYLMRTVDAEAMRASDPRRLVRDELMRRSKLEAESTSAFGERGYLNVSRNPVRSSL